MTEKVIIIGSGPAAWTAAIYAARANLKPLVVEGAITEENRLRNTLPGGQLSLTTEVENYPGFPNGVDGTALVCNMRDQAIRFGTRTSYEDVTSVDYGTGANGAHVLTVSNGDESSNLEALAVIVATGASAKYLEVPGEERFKNNGVSACAVCDGGLPRFRDKPVVVVGGGDSACEEANYLSKYASEVILVHRRDTLNRASPIMAERTLANPKIKPLWNMKVSQIGGRWENGVEWVTCVPADYDTNNGLALIYKTVKASGVFCAIGHAPNTRFLKTKTENQPAEEGVIVDKWGYIVTGRDYGSPRTFHTNTNIDGIFAAGDVADPTYRQAITAAGSGCKAALDVERWLAQKGIH